MNADALLLAFLLAPLAQAGIFAITARLPAVRDVASILSALAYAALAAALTATHMQGGSGYVVLAQPLPDAEIGFAPEPFGLTVALTLSVLGVLNASFVAGYLRAIGDAAPARAQILNVATLAAANAAALASNLLTFLLCYEALAVAAFGLAVRGDASARRAAGLVLVILLGAAIGLLMPAMAWTHALAGRLDFVAGGLLAGRVEPGEADALLLLFAFGLAGAAIAPAPIWLPLAMRARTPAAGAAFAVQIVSVGALGLLKISHFIFGAALDQAYYGRMALLALAAGGGLLAALYALSKDEAKTRLGYLTIAHAALATAGAVLGSPLAVFAAAFQIVAHAVAKASLFFTIGAMQTVTGRTRFSEMAGLGRRMPWAFAGFALAALSVSGLPPLAGAWSLLWLVAGAAEAGQGWAAALILITALVSFAALCMPAARALFAPAPPYPFERPDAASALLIAPVAVAVALSVALVLLIDPLSRFLGVRLAP
ncbi:MAG: proton-conducting transporter membrane subunit [Hyphomonadaceae bacterium]